MRPMRLQLRHESTIRAGCGRCDSVQIVCIPQSPCLPRVLASQPGGPSARRGINRLVAGTRSRTGAGRVLNSRGAATREISLHLAGLLSALTAKWPALTSLKGAPAYNVGRAYAAFAADIENGTHTVPDFADAVRRHEVIAAIETSAASGERVKM